MGGHDHAAMTQLLIRRDFRSMPALGNLFDAELLFAVESFGDDGRASGFYQRPLLAATRSQPGMGALATQLVLKLG